MIFYSIIHSQTKRWNQPVTHGEGPNGRRSHSAFVHNDMVYIFGGYNGNEDKHFADLWVLDPVTFTWNRLNPRGGVPSPRRDLGGRRVTVTPVAEGDAAAAIAAALAAAAAAAADGNNGNILVDAENNGGIVVDAGGDVGGGGAVPTVSQRAPCARRRQCCCVVKDTVILFGGTSPAVEQVEDSEFNLMDHSDLYVLDFYPSLKTLCLIAVVDNKLDTSLLPRDLQWDIISMTTNSNISRPLANNG